MISKIQSSIFYTSLLSLIILIVASVILVQALSANESVSAKTDEPTKTNWEIYLVRHAEKEKDVGGNPHLTERGKLRAKNLAKMLKDKNIKVIYSTEYARTLETAKPIANEIGTSVQSYDPRKLEKFSQSINSKLGNVLIVGHSNTTPVLVNLLGGEAGGDIDESEYDRVYKLIVNDNKIITEILRSSPKQ